MLGVGGLSLSLGRAGEGGGGRRGGGHLSRRMLLLDRPFFPRFLHMHSTQNLSHSSDANTSLKFLLSNISGIIRTLQGVMAHFNTKNVNKKKQKTKPQTIYFHLMEGL